MPQGIRQHHRGCGGPGKPSLPRAGRRQGPAAPRQSRPRGSFIHSCEYWVSFSGEQISLLRAESISMVCTQSPAYRDLRVSPGSGVQTRKHTACDVGPDGGVRVPGEQRRGCWDAVGSDWGFQHPLVHQFDVPLTASSLCFPGAPGLRGAPSAWTGGLFLYGQRAKCPQV